MKKLLVLTDRYKPEEFLINELVDEFSENGYEVTVVTLVPTYPFGEIYNGYKNNLFSSSFEKGIKIIRFRAVTGYKSNKLKKIFSFFNYVVFASIFVLLKAYKYDRIFIYHVGALTIGIPGVIAKLYNKPVTIWSQDIWPDSVFPNGFYGIKKFYLFFIELLVMVVYRVIDNVIVSCEPFIDVIKRYVPDKNIYYLPNWAISECEVNTKEKILLSNKINITFAGNINKWRSLDTIIKAFHEYNINSYAQLNIVGDGSGLEELKKYKNNNNLEDVVFWGRVPSKDISKYYDASDILLISLAPNKCYSLYLPAKFSTYLTTGKPILAVMRGAVPELMKSYNVGVTSIPDDIEEVKRAFDKILRLNEIEKKYIKDESSRLLKDHFEKNKIIKSILNILN
jgi:glycosyltransferase involved in cell wall biosynthesis